MTKRATPSNPTFTDPPPRTFATMTLGTILPKITRQAFKKRSPSGASLMADWGLVVGPELAAMTQPKQLSGTTLTISCAGTMAMELSHQTTSLLARINAYAGQRLVENLRFVQEVYAKPLVEIRVKAGEPVPIEGYPPGEVHDALARIAAALAADQSSREI